MLTSIMTLNSTLDHDLQELGGLEVAAQQHDLNQNQQDVSR